jgi:dTDP-4-amino-4,6-dideoxygalactose transaminase
MEQTMKYHYPEISSIRTMIDGIWKRKYYTNQGPLANELELKIQQSLGVNHAIAMANCDIGLLIALLALGEKSLALIPNYHPYYLKNALIRMNIPALDHAQDIFGVEKNLPAGISVQKNQVVFGFHALGKVTDVTSLVNYCATNHSDLVLVSDNLYESFQSQAECKCKMVELFSFEQSQLVNGGEGACVVTNDKELAAKMRNIRSSYGAGQPVEIPFTGNGRMSEFQAGMALLSLKGLDNYKNQVRLAHLAATSLLADHGIRGENIIPTGDSYFAFRSNNASLASQIQHEIASLGFVRIDIPFYLPENAVSSFEHIFLFMINAIN